jgi:hypothetical protein
MLIAARLQQNIDDITVLIHGTPKILLLAVDSDEEFVQIPGVTEASLSLANSKSDVKSEAWRTLVRLPRCAAARNEFIDRWQQNDSFYFAGKQNSRLRPDRRRPKLDVGTHLI